MPTTPALPPPPSPPEDGDPPKFGRELVEEAADREVTLPVWLRFSDMVDGTREAIEGLPFTSLEEDTAIFLAISATSLPAGAKRSFSTIRGLSIRAALLSVRMGSR
jgi:hypothetical protein